MPWRGGYSEAEIIKIFRDKGYPMQRIDQYAEMSYEERLEEFPRVMLASGILGKDFGVGCVIIGAFIAPLDDGTLVGLDSTVEGNSRFLDEGESLFWNYDMLSSWFPAAWDDLTMNLRYYFPDEPLDDFCIFLDKGTYSVGFSAAPRSGFAYKGYGLSIKTFLRRESYDHLILPKDTTDLTEPIDRIYNWLKDIMSPTEAFYEDIPAPPWCFTA